MQLTKENYYKDLDPLLLERDNRILAQIIRAGHPGVCISDLRQSNSQLADASIIQALSRLVDKELVQRQQRKTKPKSSPSTRYVHLPKVTTVLGVRMRVSDYDLDFSEPTPEPAEPTLTVTNTFGVEYTTRWPQYQHPSPNEARNEHQNRNTHQASDQG